MKKTISIRARLFILFFIIFMSSIIFLTYMATRIVMQFGEYSAKENETSIKSQASFFLSRMTHEKAMRCESIFERIAVSSASLALHTAVTMNMADLPDQTPFRKPDMLTRPPGSRLYSNAPTDPVMVLYWGEESVHPGIISRLNAMALMDPLLKNIIENNPEAVACFITSEKAITRYYPNFSSIIRKLGADAYEIRDSDWYMAVRPENNPERRTKWSDVYQDPAGRGLMTTALTPIYSAGDQFLGVTGVDVTLVNIIDKILADTGETSVTGTRDLFSFITDDTGRIVAFPGEYLSMFGFADIAKENQIGYNALLDIRLSDSRNPDVRQLWTTGKKRTDPDQQRILIENKQFLISSVTMPSTGWRLGVAVPESNLLETIQTTRSALRSMVNTMVFKFGSFALLVMVLSIAGFMILSLKYFIRPLDMLTQAAVSVKEGDLSRQVPIERNDEIGILARTFNTMVSELEKLHIKDKAHAFQLQQKVRERTVELEEKTRLQDKTLARLQQEIGERKHAQEMIKQAKKMAEDASRAKSEFLTIMSHEIRTPLNAIIGMTRLTLTTRLEEQQKEYLDAVLISSDHLLSLLNNILDFSKIEAGKFVLENQAFDIESLLHDMMTMFSFQARKKQLDINYFTGDIPRYVRGDMHRLRQILVNLVGNAIKFTRSGSITINVDADPHLEAKNDRREVKLIFSIQDTGVGIPSDKLSEVFNDFTQLNDVNVTDSGGTGLGLTITRQLIHLMDGDIWVESESGSGSTFYFTIRLKTATQNAVRQVLGKGLESAALSFETPVTPLHILLAEDFEVNRKLLEPFLAQHGHDVTSVENGEQALEMLSRQPFDMVLMDIKMPVMDGIEATRRIRQHTDVDIAGIPVIALTAHAIKGDRERFLAASMDEYITKPIHGDELLMMMERLAKNRKETGRSQEPVDKKMCNRSHALQLMGGNEDIVDAVIKTMIIRFPEEIEKIRAAIEKQDFDTVTMAAHAMKSGLKSIDAGPVLACVEQVETAGKSQDHARCQALMRSLEPLTEELVRQLGESLSFSKPDNLG